MDDLLMVHAGFGVDAVPYEQAWDLQRSAHASVVTGDQPDTVLLLEHPPVYTAGRRTHALERPTDGTPVVDVDRGGKITWHGPGQLVGYPIVRLPDPIDVVAHVRRIEQVLIDVCSDLGLPTTRIDGRSGVWVAERRDDERGTSEKSSATNGPGDPAAGRQDRKVAAIGIRVSNGVTMHGFALNCDCDLSWFDRIVPCGITDATVTSLSHELGRPVTVHDALPLVEAYLHRSLMTEPVAASA